MRNKISEIRHKKKISQSELARGARISRTHLSDIENNKANPSVEIANRIAKTLGAKVEQIFFNNDVV